MEFQLGMSHAVSLIAGFSISVGFISKLMKDMEKLIVKIEKITVDLSFISAKLQELESGYRFVSDHEKKIAVLESKLHGSGRRS